MLIGTAAAGAIIAGARGPVNVRAQNRFPTSGKIHISQTVQDRAGNAALEYEGRAYRFSIKMAGMSSTQIKDRFGTGYVYHLSHLSNFSGSYGAVRQNVEGVRGHGFLWLENGNGVVIGLRNRSGHVAPMRPRSINIVFTD